MLVKIYWSQSESTTYLEIENFVYHFIDSHYDDICSVSSKLTNLTDFEFIAHFYIANQLVSANKRIVVMSWITLLCLYSLYLIKY